MDSDNFQFSPKNLQTPQGSLSTTWKQGKEAEVIQHLPAGFPAIELLGTTGPISFFTATILAFLTYRVSHKKGIILL